VFLCLHALRAPAPSRASYWLTSSAFSAYN
jgi:hypothetical protein